MPGEIRPETIEVLVDQHRRFLRFLEPRVGSRAVAEDILQSAFVKGLERGGELRDDESAVAWFYRLLRNAVTDFYRRRDAERRAVERHAGETPNAVTLDADLEAAVCECVNGLIPTLKPEYADILRAVEMQARPLTGVAADLGITSGNAAVRAHRARQALRKQLELACGTCTEHGCLDCDCQRKTPH